MQFIADECRLCASANPPVRTKKFRDHPGAYAVCPRCDRTQCGKCGNSVIDKKATNCKPCGWPVGKLYTEPKPKEST